MMKAMPKGNLVDNMDMIHSRRPNEKSPLFKIEVRFLKKEKLLVVFSQWIGEIA